MRDEAIPHTPDPSPGPGAGGGPVSAVGVVLVISGLGAGGSERVITTMADHWARVGRPTTLITLSDATADHYALDPRVRRVALAVAREAEGIRDRIFGNIGRARALRRALLASDATVVVSFGDRMNVLTLLATRRTPLAVVVAERNDPRHHPMGRAWGILRRLTYRLAASLVVQTEGLRPWAAGVCDRRRVDVIPNPILDPPSPAVAHPRIPRVLAAGRLAHQKGFDDLISAFALSVPEHPGWDLVIAGEGPERPALERRIAELELTGRVLLPGVVKDLGERMDGASVFVLSSRYEGFPNVLLEAMAHGLPVISTDCPSGPADIITDREDGLIVPVGAVPAMAAALHALMGDEEQRRRLGERATGVRERYSLERVMPRWERIIDRLGTR